MTKPGEHVLVSPFDIAILISCLAGLFWVLQRPRAARWLILSALVLLYLTATAAVGDMLLAPLERAYPPLPEEQHTATVGYIVVLGGTYSPRDGIPVTAALNGPGLARIVEGIRLMRRLGIAKLVVSGGAIAGEGRPAIGYAELARELGIPGSSIVVLDGPRNTAGEAQAVRDLLGNVPFILVTSAFHMPRAMRLMRRVGADPIPAPTGQLAADGRVAWADLLPSSHGLNETELALHEYLGLLALDFGIDSSKVTRY